MTVVCPSKNIIIRKIGQKSLICPHSLHGQVIKVAVGGGAPLVIFPKTRGGKLSGTTIDYMRLYAEKFKYITKVELGPMGFYNSSNGKWSGNYGKVLYYF